MGLRLNYIVQGSRVYSSIFPPPSVWVSASVQFSGTCFSLPECQLQPSLCSRVKAAERAELQHLKTTSVARGWERNFLSETICRKVLQTVFNLKLKPKWELNLKVNGTSLEIKKKKKTYHLHHSWYVCDTFWFYTNKVLILFLLPSVVSGVITLQC